MSMRKWMGLAAALIAVFALAALIVLMSRGLLGFLQAVDSKGEPDPMFAPVDMDAGPVTWPPELAEKAVPDGPAATDASASWVYEETSPVDKTPGELAGFAAPDA